MTAARIARDGRIGVAPTLRHMGQKRCRQKRHVAGYHQYLFRRRLHQRRIKTTKRASPGDAISNDRYARHTNMRLIARDNNDVRGETTEER